MGPPDGILGLVEAFKADTHPKKVNLSVGAYRDGDGKPWVLPSVLKAEERVMEQSMNKEYLPIVGDADFVDRARCAHLWQTGSRSTPVPMPRTDVEASPLRRFALGDASPALAEKRVASVQSLSGTGACRVIGEFYSKFLGRGAPFYLPTPSWGNHGNIFRDAGLDVRTYRYWDDQTLGLGKSAPIEPPCGVHATPVAGIAGCA